MNTEINKKISQFLDDELHHSELGGLLLGIKQQPELKNTMKRYQIVNHFLRTEEFTMVDKFFLDNINKELGQEPHYLPPVQAVKTQQANFWQKTTFAIAASVLCVSVIVSQKVKLQNIDKQSEATLISQKEAVEVKIQVAKNTQKSQHERLKAYLHAHSDDLYTHGSLSVHPYAHVASYGQ